MGSLRKTWTGGTVTGDLVSWLSQLGYVALRTGVIACSMILDGQNSQLCFPICTSLN